MLRFVGHIKSGIGKHSKLVLPDSSVLSTAPPDWPKVYTPGSLNVTVMRDGYPSGFADPELGGQGVVLLDGNSIPPTVEVPWDQITNNSLTPKPNAPNRGQGRFWRSRLTVESTGQSAHCWVFRRIGSTIKRQFEIVAGTHLRTAMTLTDGMAVVVILIGTH